MTRHGFLDMKWKQSLSFYNGQNIITLANQRMSEPFKHKHDVDSFFWHQMHCLFILHFYLQGRLTNHNLVVIKYLCKNLRRNWHKLRHANVQFFHYSNAPAYVLLLAFASFVPNICSVSSVTHCTHPTYPLPTF